MNYGNIFQENQNNQSLVPKHRSTIVVACSNKRIPFVSAVISHQGSSLRFVPSILLEMSEKKTFFSKEFGRRRSLTCVSCCRVQRLTVLQKNRYRVAPHLCHRIVDSQNMICCSFFWIDGEVDFESLDSIIESTRTASGVAQIRSTSGRDTPNQQYQLNQFGTHQSHIQ